MADHENGKTSRKSNPMLEGWLTKQGIKGVRALTWKKRWFILKENVLVYYRAPQDNIVLGSIDIASISDIFTSAKNKQIEPNSFQLITPTRTFKLKAGSESERDAWVTLIQKLIGSRIQSLEKKLEEAQNALNSSRLKERELLKRIHDFEDDLKRAKDQQSKLQEELETLKKNQTQTQQQTQPQSRKPSTKNFFTQSQQTQTQTNNVGLNVSGTAETRKVNELTRKLSEKEHEIKALEKLLKESVGDRLSEEIKHLQQNSPHGTHNESLNVSVGTTNNKRVSLDTSDMSLLSLLDQVSGKVSLNDER